MNYYDQIDTIGEEQDYCDNCGKKCIGAYCSDACKIEDNQ